MCGIYGKYCFEGHLDIGESLAALDMIKHRGPDGYGFEYGQYSGNTHKIHHNITPESFADSEADYFLGHRRLSIVDLSENAFQPMESSCKRYSVTFNGEIYNYIELKEELLALGRKFNTDHSDTEVLLNAYVTWGVDCVDRFRGMFAFAIFDREAKTLFVARDRIGQKTVYYELTDSAFTFASELPPIVKFGHKRNISAVALNLYMSLGYIPYPHSIFEGVRKLPPATYAIIDLERKSIDLHEYWDVDFHIDSDKNAEKAMQAAQEALQESVRYRLRADVSVGAFISGGTDSTLIVKNISEAGQNRFDIYGADFPNTNRSEKKYIVEAADRYGQNLKLSDIDITHSDNIQAIVNVFDEPFDGASSIALFDLFKEAAKDHKIILTGDGGDEMFAGYSRYISFPKRDALIKTLQRLVLPKVILSLCDRVGLLPEKLESLRTQLDGNTVSNSTGLNTNSSYTRLIKEKYQVEDIRKAGVFANIAASIRQKGFSTVKALQYLELKTILPGRMLYKLDRFSMFYGVEARSPFLDHKLVEMAYTIPDEVNISGGVTKSVLKNILSQDFDDKFVHRDKQGFGSPLTNWFKASKSKEILAILRDRSSAIFSYLDFEATNRKIGTLENGSEDFGEKRLWRILVLAHYFENYKHFVVDPE